jgi:hypothetical protein
MIVISADVEKITSQSSTSINASLYDTDEFLEEQRLQMCRRAIRTAPEIDAKLFENIVTGMNKYYAITLTQEKGAPIDVILQAFDCPSQPKFYVYINAYEDKHNLWAIVKENDLTKRPAFGIMAYKIMMFKSISIYEGQCQITSSFHN